MSRWLIVILVIALVGLLLFRRRERLVAEQKRLAAEQKRRDDARRLENSPSAEQRSLGAVGVAAVPEAAAAKSTERVRGTFQEAADAAIGREYAEATGQIQDMNADLATARKGADREAAMLADEADAALAAVQVSAAALGGAVPGDGTPNCPAEYPIKGNVPARLFTAPGQRGYDGTTPEVCFQNAAAAEAAGFSPIEDETLADGEPVVADGGGGAAGIVAGAAVAGERANSSDDVVVEAIEAAEADSVPAGAVRGDGGRECPSAYPVKGNASSMLYHEPSSRSYTVTIPEFCFSTVEAAEAAGFSAPRR